MSKQQMRDAEPVSPVEDQVVEHLTAHPEFFERHPAVLARLKLPHQRGTAAVSLVERQMLVLRERHAALEQKLHELIENGRSNDTIVERMHRLSRRLLRARALCRQGQRRGSGVRPADADAAGAVGLVPGACRRPPWRDRLRNHRRRRRPGGASFE